MGFFNRLFGKSNSDKSAVLLSLQRELDLINESAKILENTVNPDTFFSRYDFYIERLASMAEKERSGVRDIRFSGESFIGKYERMSSETHRIKMYNDFIDRMWDDTCQKAKQLKTERGRQSRYHKFLTDLQVYDHRLPSECIQHYQALFQQGPSLQANKSSSTARHQIPASEIDRMQRIEASEHYRRKIYKRYYSNYPEMPYISQDRELNTDWIEQASVSPTTKVIPKTMMTRFVEDGILPGHVYMLYWLSNVRRKRIPSYFEYKYGIDFAKEKQFLIANNFIDSDDNLTQKGKDAIERHKEVIEEHSGTQHSQKSKLLDASSPDNQSAFKSEVDKLIQIGLDQGKNSISLARLLRRKFDISKTDAEQLMATEMRRARTEEAKQSYIRNGNTHYQFLALGKDPCTVCKALNGKVFPVKDLTPGKNAPPMHPSCECTTAPYWDEAQFQK